MEARGWRIRRAGANSLLCSITAFLIGCGGGPAAGTKSAGPTAADGLANLKSLFTQVAQGATTLPKSLAEFTAVEPFFPVAGPFVLGGQIDCDWGAGLKSTADAATHRLAFEKRAADEGGWVLLQDGTIREVTADEFRKLSKAVP
jgi:hypothetical protein